MDKRFKQVKKNKKNFKTKAKQFVKRQAKKGGKKLLRVVGKTLRKAAMTIIGGGEYNLVGNDTRSVDIRGFGPLTQRITHREYIGDITSSSVTGDFLLGSYDIQPANYVAFPWLANIAKCFSHYKVKGLVYEFLSASGTAVNSTNIGLGQVMCAISYDPLNTDPVSKSQFLQLQDATSKAPYESFAVPLETKFLNYDKYFVATSDADTTSMNIAQTNVGKFYIASSGLPGASNVVGSLWVSYDIEFFTAVFPEILGLEDFWNITDCDAIAPYNVVGSEEAAYSNLDISFTSNHQEIQYNQTGRYVHTLVCTGSNNVAFGTWSQSIISGTGDIALLKRSGDTTDLICIVYEITVTKAPCIVKNAWDSGPTDSSGYVRIVKIN